MHSVKLSNDSHMNNEEHVKIYIFFLLAYKREVTHFEMGGNLRQ